MDKFLRELERCIGYPIAGTWLESMLEKNLSADEEERALDFEILVSRAVPCDVEPVRIEPSEPYPQSTPGLVATHFSGLFATDALSASIGGHVPGVFFAIDLNQLGANTPVYLVTENDGVPESLLPYTYLADGGPEATARFRERWADVEQLSVADPPEPEDLEQRAREFATTYPGVARLRADFLKRFAGVTAVREPEPAPATQVSLYRAFERIAPAFIEARGLPAVGADPEGAAEAQRLATAEISGPETPCLLASVLVPWVAGHEAVAKAAAERIAAKKLGAPLAQRWAKRVLGQEDAS